mmetsp:Transcript_51359/g.116801  ORF Transcript_51359/g.116801 Transcript_51359/m.116801 type:complete len:215 (-) Transcript_51359:984-1628(-)
MGRLCLAWLRCLDLGPSLRLNVRSGRPPIAAPVRPKVRSRSPSCCCPSHTFPRGHPSRNLRVHLLVAGMSRVVLPLFLPPLGHLLSPEKRVQSTMCHCCELVGSSVFSWLWFSYSECHTSMSVQESKATHQCWAERPSLGPPHLATHFAWRLPASWVLRLCCLLPEGLVRGRSSSLKKKVSGWQKPLGRFRNGHQQCWFLLDPRPLIEPFCTIS